jgi:hypothetical protein
MEVEPELSGVKIVLVRGPENLVLEVNTTSKDILVPCQVSFYMTLELLPLPEADISIKGQNVNFKN